MWCHFFLNEVLEFSSDNIFVNQWKFIIEDLLEIVSSTYILQRYSLELNIRRKKTHVKIKTYRSRQSILSKKSNIKT